jgi:hypothetical protein
MTLLSWNALLPLSQPPKHGGHPSSSNRTLLIALSSRKTPNLLFLLYVKASFCPSAAPCAIHS